MIRLNHSVLEFSDRDIVSYYRSLNDISGSKKLNTKLIETARNVNESLVNYLVSEILNESKKVNLNNKEMNLLFIGATFKEDCPDTRNSKSFELIKKLRSYDINIHYRYTFIVINARFFIFRL